MIIILEGPDGSGKSTLAKQLETTLDGIYHHSGRPTSKDDMQKILIEVESLAGSRDLYIVDRTPWISEFIYSKAFDNPMLADPEELMNYWELPQLIVYCTPTGISHIDVSDEEKEHKPKDYLERVKKKHETIVDLYDQFFENNRDLKVTRYNWKRESIKDLLVKLCAGL